MRQQREDASALLFGRIGQSLLGHLIINALGKIADLRFPGQGFGIDRNDHERVGRQHAETQPDRIEIRLRQIGCKAISGFIYALPGHTPCFDITNINKKSIRQPGIHTIIDPEQIFFHLTGASCPNSVEQTRNPGRTTGTNTAKGALHRHLSPSRIESNGYWHLSAICSIQRAFATTAAWPPEILLIN